MTGGVYSPALILVSKPQMPSTRLWLSWCLGLRALDRHTDRHQTEPLMWSLTHIVAGGLVLRGSLDGVGQEAEDGADPQKDGEATEELAAELDPLRGGWGRGEGVGAVPGQVLCRLGVGQTLREAKEWRDGRWEMIGRNNNDDPMTRQQARNSLGRCQCCTSGKPPPQTFYVPSMRTKGERTNTGSQSLHVMGSNG